AGASGGDPSSLLPKKSRRRDGRRDQPGVRGGLSQAVQPRSAKSQGQAAGHHALVANAAGGVTMRVLFVSPYIPSPVRVRPYQWIRALARHGQRVRLIALQPPEDRWVSATALADCCEQIRVFRLSRLQTLRNAAAALPRDLPLQAAYSLHPEAERFVASEARHCDIVHVEHLRGSLLARRVRHVPCVIDAVDSISSLFAQAVRE